MPTIDPGNGAGKSLRRLLFEAGKKAVEERGEELKTELAGVTGGGQDKSMDTAKSLDIQFKVGEYSTLTQTVTGLEKNMRDTLSGVTRNLQ